MKTAEQIMKSKRFIKEELDRQLPKTLSDELWKKAETRLAGYLRQYADISKGEHTHTDNFIFPATAIYLTMKEVTTQEQAYSVIEKAAIRNSGDAGRKLAKLMRAPAMRSLFVWIWDPMTKKMFGANSGFQNVFYPKVKGEYRMDVVSCPYCKYFTELGCPELTKIFCANDDRVYGNLPGLEFRRTGTLGTGADRCDFYLGKTRTAPTSARAADRDPEGRKPQ